MSKTERIYIVLATVAVVIAALTLWVALRHEQEHRSDLMSEVLVAALALIYMVGGGWAIYRNLKDAHRADDLKQHHEELRQAISRPLTVDTAQLAADLLAEIKKQRPPETPPGDQPYDNYNYLPPVQKDPDLRGEISEILFREEDASAKAFAFTPPSVKILIKVTLTNHGTKNAVVVQWILNVQIGTESVCTIPAISIPAGWSLKNYSEVTHYAIADLAAIAQDNCTQGIPKSGWLLFDLSPLWMGWRHPCAAV